MSKQQVRYIVKRNYSTSRTGTDAFIKLIKNDKSPDISRNDNIRENNIEYTQYNMYKNDEICYTEDSFRESCVIPINPKEE
jgi:hypothetical protein